MTQKTGKILLAKIIPIIQGTVPMAVQTTRCEDFDELVQDCIHQAAKMLDSAEKTGKKVPARSVAYYAIQRAKSGRRSWTSSATDAMSPLFKAGSSEDSIVSLDAPVSDMNECLTMHDFISSRKDDPSDEALRRIDWDEFNETLNHREKRMVQAIAEGKQFKSIADELDISPGRITQIKGELGSRIRQFMGDSILNDISSETPWKRDIRALREKEAWRFATMEDEPA